MDINEWIFKLSYYKIYIFNIASVFIFFIIYFPQKFKNKTRIKWKSYLYYSKKIQLLRKKRRRKNSIS